MRLQELKDQLEEIRANKELWHQFAYISREEDYDNKRCALAFLISSNLQDADEELVRFLLENEMESCYMGNSECLTYLVYALAEFRNPANVWLLIQAKFNNFDNYFLVDHEHVFSAGFQVTCDYIEQNGYPDAHPDLRDYIEEVKEKITEEDVQRFWERLLRRKQYIQEENKIVDELELCMLLDEPQDKLVELFEILERDESISLNTLVDLAERIELLDRAIFYQKKVVEQAETKRVKLDAQSSLVKLYKQAKDYIPAIEIQKELVKHADSQWEYKQLIDLYEIVGEFQQAIVIQNSLIYKQKSRLERVDMMLGLVNLYIKSQDYRNAYFLAQRWYRIALRFQDWRSANVFSWELFEQWIQISKGLAENEEPSLAKKSLKKAERIFYLSVHKEDIHYRRLAECSEFLGLQKRADHYHRMTK